MTAYFEKLVRENYRFGRTRCLGSLNSINIMLWKGSKI